ncbi:MAG: hypothetical protein ABEL51_12635 [Salinibacter sp.]
MSALFERLWNWWQARRTRQITEPAVRERVQRGADYLDDMDPGWHRRIDPDALELENGRRCVLGQLHGEFRLGLGRSGVLSLSSAPRASLSPVAYGFKCVEGVSDEQQARDYDLLTQAWRGAIRSRWADDITGGEAPDLETVDEPIPGETVSA